ncbi:alpha/beta fold hydrolase [Arthrobacter castelli]|uniref:alpha/beta fold hydrolase n=1 Tax=Arthrobacter castelli TaxID=271431 RepID=UPI000687D62B|nr:alpha/beta hydrolase [Arthrobacter castelli]
MVEWTLPERWDAGDGEVHWGAFGEGPAMVLLHGTPFSSFIWRDIVPVLARDHTVYVWDMLGFGASGKDSLDVSLRRQATIFVDLLQHWGIETPRVVAHDVGGVVALRTTLLHEMTFRSLTLIDAASVTGWGSGGFFQAVHAHPGAFSELPDWASDALVDAKIRSGSHMGLRADARQAYVDQWATPEARLAFYRQYAQGGEEHTGELQDLLGSLTVPLHVIWGAQDRWLDLDYARRLVEALPRQTRFSVIEGAGHMVPEDQPGALLQLLSE